MLFKYRKVNNDDFNDLSAFNTVSLVYLPLCNSVSFFERRDVFETDSIKKFLLQ